MQIGAGVGIGQRHQRRQGVDALGQILPGRFEQLRFGGGDVEDVVADLEHHAEAVAVFGERLHLGCGQPSGQ